MAGLAHFTRSLLLQNFSKINSAQIVRNSSYYRKKREQIEFYDADRLDDGATVRAVMDGMANRGFCRAQRPYTPPEDLRERLIVIFKKHMPEANLSDLRTARMTQPAKVRILAECVREFDHDVPNYELARIRTLGGVEHFFSIKVDGLNPYEKLLAQKDKLPDNLHVIAEPIRFHPDTDTMFKGVTAYPGHGTQVSGLRTKKKYASWKTDKEWPYETHTSKTS